MQIELKVGPGSDDLSFQLNESDRMWLVIISGDFLADEVGSQSTTVQRREWVETNLSDLVSSAKFKIKSVSHKVTRFDRVIVREIN